MKQRILLLLSLTLLLLVAAVSVQAQDILAPDEAIEGEITDENYAVEYLYKGTADEIVVIDLIPEDVLADLDNPSIVVMLPGNEVLVRRDGFGATNLVTILPSDGTYRIIATRRDDAEGTSVGKYTLLLRNPIPMELGASYAGSIGDDEAHYYSYRGDADFSVIYAREGTFAPEMSVNTVDMDVVPGRLITVLGIYGQYSTEGIVGVVPGGETYVIALDRSLGDFSFGDPTASYVIELTPADE